MAARLPAPADPSAPPFEECNFFIDDSNIWIEAQKYAASGNSHMPKITDVDQDPRLRINVGRMVTMLLRGRVQGDSTLYGSRPPPNDAVWKAVQKYNFRTNIFSRGMSRNGGKLGTEKGVDASMVADITRMATRLDTMAEVDPKQWGPVKARRTFICVTGDRDFLTTIKQVLDVGIRVELWAWRSGLASAYRYLDDEQRKTPGATPFEVNFLDDVFEHVYFTNYFSTHKGKHVDPAKAVVLLDFTDEWWSNSEAGSINGDSDHGEGGGGPSLTSTELWQFEQAVCSEMQNMGRLFHVTKEHGPGKTVAELVLIFEFPRVKDIEPTLLRIRHNFTGLATAVSWLQYNALCQARKHTPSTVLDTSDMITTVYAPLSSDTAEVEETEDLSWSTVSYTDPKKIHQRNMVRQEPCPLGIHCDKASNCPRQHTNHERSLFRDLPNQDFRFYKTSKCKHLPNCNRRRLCTFAHSASEAWCSACKVEGHFVDTCKYKSSTRTQ
ncbi:hypothetical protein SBRCBS47491_001919 [Sporothrix bragantina]|uniref:NYN domain-containing protein n=1 Tax=Sporothrix bragantina TaxID=671064 RepID=A0ABP0B2K8_9PEZI